ncbi:MAG: sigma-54-dependent transcriptional regulator [Bacteriovoracaceae bacterium]
MSLAVSIQKRNFSPRTFPGLSEKGLRLGDEILVNPISGRRKVIKLHRTHIHFLSTDDHSSLEAHPILLPTLADEELSYSLLLCADGGTESENRARYLLRSNLDRPFKINGSYSFEAFVERGDKIQLGYNLLEMRPIVESKNQEILTHDILRNKKLLESDLNILIQGQTGSGKTHLAKLIHKYSGRKGPLVHVNLSAFSPSIVESELFGHVKGAFTGALVDKKGAFLEARDGTLFLDEIDSLPLEIQTKLLLFLDNKQIRPVGGNRIIECPTRLIFAGARNLSGQVEKKLMREDFYFRLSSGHKIELAPLRNHPEAIKNFCLQFSLEQDVSFTTKLLEFYQTLPWPGNIRHLRGHLEKKKALSPSRKIDFDELDEELITQSSSLMKLDPEENEYLPLRKIQKSYSWRVYQSLGQDLGKASKSLGISPRRLRRIISSP